MIDKKVKRLFDKGDTMYGRKALAELLEIEPIVLVRFLNGDSHYMPDRAIGKMASLLASRNKSETKKGVKNGRVRKNIRRKAGHTFFGGAGNGTGHNGVAQTGQQSHSFS